MLCACAVVSVFASCLMSAGPQAMTLVDGGPTRIEGATHLVDDLGTMGLNDAVAAWRAGRFAPLKGDEPT